MIKPTNMHKESNSARDLVMVTTTRPSNASLHEMHSLTTMQTSRVTDSFNKMEILPHSKEHIIL
jgi:hypothetical protein